MADLCTLSGTFCDPAGSPFGGAKIVIRPVSTQPTVRDDGSIVAAVAVSSFETAEDGVVTIGLAPGLYRGSATQGAGGRSFAFDLAVPDLQTAPLEDYIGRIDVEVQTSAQRARDEAQQARDDIFADGGVVTLTGTQTLSSKTLAAPAVIGGLQVAGPFWLDGYRQQPDFLNVAQMVAYSGHAEGAIVSVACRSVIGDRGAGAFVIMTPANWGGAVDDLGAVYALSGGLVAIRLEFLTDRRLEPYWFGATGTSTATQDTALNRWIAAYGIHNTQVPSTDTIVTANPWMHVPAGLWRWGTFTKWNPKNGYPNIRGDGSNSILRGLGIALYNDLSLGSGSQTFFRVQNLKMHGGNTNPYAICLGNPDDPLGSWYDRWGGTQRGLVEDIVITNYTRAGFIGLRDNNSRIQNVTVHRSKYGFLLLGALGTNFSQCDGSFNTLDGWRVQPLAGDASAPPVTLGAIVGGVSWDDNTGRGNGRHNFIALGGDSNTVIYPDDPDAKWIDFEGASSIRISHLWESYQHNCSWANLSTGNPPLITRPLTVTSIVQDTSAPLSIRVTTTTPHYFYRGLPLQEVLSFSDVPGYESVSPRDDDVFVVGEIYSPTEFALNVAYVSDFSGVGTINLPNFECVIRGMEKGYSPDNVLDLWLTGKNHNYTYLERVTNVYGAATRYKLQIICGPEVLGFERSHQMGTKPDINKSLAHMPITGAGAMAGHITTGLRRFDLPSFATLEDSNPYMTAANIGYSVDLPYHAGAARTDHVAGAPRDFLALHLRPDAAVLGVHDVQADTYQGLSVNAATGNMEWVSSGEVLATFDRASGQLIGGAAMQEPLDATAGRLLAVGASATLLAASPALRQAVGGTPGAITLTTGAGFSGTLPTGIELRFRASAPNPAGGTTIAVDGVPPIACRTRTGAVLPAGYIRADVDTIARHDGTYLVLGREVETGSNANGDWMRWEDGSQTCWKRMVIKPAADATTGIKSVTWTFPAAFVAGATRTVVKHGITSTNPIQRGQTSTNAQSNTDVVLYYNEGGGTGVDVYTLAEAIGRWY